MTRPTAFDAGQIQQLLQAIEGLKSKASPNPPAFDSAQFERLLHAIDALKTAPAVRSLPLEGAQFQQLLHTIDGLKPAPGWHWHDNVPIFLSSLGGLVVGILLDLFRRWREREKALLDRYDREFQQAKGALVGIGYNIQILLTTTAQNILPHYYQSQAAHADSQTAFGDGAKMELFVMNPFHRYPAVLMICPLPYFVETDFLDKLPFLVEKEPNLVMDAALPINFSRLLTSHITARNQQIGIASSAVFQKGTMSFQQIQTIVQLQESIATAECVTALELFEAFQRVAASLEKVLAAYALKRKQPKKDKRESPALVTPVALMEYLTKLRTIRSAALLRMPS